MRTQRILGELLKNGKETGEIRKPTDNQYSATTAREVAEFGLSHKQSSAFQQIADIPEETLSNVSFSGNLQPHTGPVHVVGTQVQFYDRLSDGRMILRNERFVPNKPLTSSLRDIWVKGSPLTYEIFMERVKNGLVENSNVWTGGSVSINETYIFLAYDIGCIKKDRRTEDIYRAFKGSFTIPKVNTPRALRDRKSTETKTYRDRKRAFRGFLYNLFYDFCSENMRGTNMSVNSRNNLK